MCGWTGDVEKNVAPGVPPPTNNAAGLPLTQNRKNARRQARRSRELGAPEENERRVVGRHHLRSSTLGREGPERRGGGKSEDVLRRPSRRFATLSHYAPGLARGMTSCKRRRPWGANVWRFCTRSVRKVKPQKKSRPRCPPARAWKVSTSSLIKRTLTRAHSTHAVGPAKGYFFVSVHNSCC